MYQERAPIQRRNAVESSLMQYIDAAYPINSIFEFYEDFLDVVPLYISGSYVEVVEHHLGGSGGLGGADANVSKY